MKHLNRLQDEQGAVLISGLVLLLVLTLLGVAGMQGTTLEERMTSNFEQMDLSFQAAEAGLRDAEQWLAAQVAGGSLPAFTGANGLYTPSAPGNPSVWETIDWTDVNDIRIYNGGDLGGAPYPLPRYIIEFVATINSGSDSLAADEVPEELGMYRVTSRGVSGSGRSEVWLQSTYLR